MSAPKPTVRVTLVDPTGAGKSEGQDVAKGTTLGDFMACYFENTGRKAEGVAIKVNRQDVKNDYVLQQGDRVSLYFGNLQAA